MKPREISFIDKNLLLVILAFVCAVSLSACSLHDSKKQSPSPVVLTCPPPPKIPEDPYCPYYDVKYDFPMTAVCNPKIYVFKNERRLLLVNDGVLIRNFPIALGPHPAGDKLMQGDGRTPEGEFFICAKNAASKFYKSLGVSYPTPKHAEQALFEGRISADQYRSIVEAIDRKTLPPFNTSLGGAIFIHGGGTQEDWTEGCIAVNNYAIDELFEVIPVGTPVKILP